MSTSFGYLNYYGYGGHVFPIVLGESGSAYTDVRPLVFKQLSRRHLKTLNACQCYLFPNPFWVPITAPTADLRGDVY